jgi:hypothetical protein
MKRTACAAALALATAAQAQGLVPEPVKARVNELVAQCVAAGGALGSMSGQGRFVIPQDFTGDGRTDFLISEGNVPCIGKPTLFRPDGLAKVELWVGTGAGGATLAFADRLLAYRVLAGPPARLQIARRGPACGAARCGDELRWNAAAARFDIAPTDGRQVALAAAPGAASPVAAPAPAAARAGTLPLKRGYFVSADTPCNRASNATVNLFTGDGLNASRSVCTFTRVEPQGNGRFRVAQRCQGLGGFGGDEQPEVSTISFEIPDDSRFTIRWPEGGSSSSRYCPQASMNEPFRSNDIRDLTR